MPCGYKRHKGMVLLATKKESMISKAKKKKGYVSKRTNPVLRKLER